MKPAFEELLYKSFPTVFPNALEWGFEHGNGWFPIVFKLAQAFEKHNLESAERHHAVQVKEKFGGLRFYTDASCCIRPTDAPNDVTYSGLSPSLEAWVREAERAAYRTCEFCGGQGRVRFGSYIRTLCDECDFKKGCKRCFTYRFKNFFKRLRAPK